MMLNLGLQATSSVPILSMIKSKCNVSAHISTKLNQAQAYCQDACHQKIDLGKKSNEKGLSWFFSVFRRTHIAGVESRNPYSICEAVITT